jgi:hypothetical protein
MKVFANLSPLQLTSIALIGSFIGSATFLLPIAPGSPRRSVWIPIDVAFFATGIFLTFKATSALKKGVANLQWPAAQIENVRSILDSSAVSFLYFAFLLAYVSMVFQQNSLRHIGWCFFLPAQAISQLRLACKPPAQKGPFERLDWRSIPPLQSSHWGER